MSDQNNSIKLPINRNGRSCTNEYGCDCLFNGDSVYVDDRTIDSHIKRLRKKFRLIDSSFDQIRTRYGLGYSWRD